MASWFLRSAGADTFSPTSYTIVGPSAPLCPGTNPFICAILAEPDSSNRPVLTDDLRADMEFAITNNTDLSNVLLRTAF